MSKICITGITGQLGSYLADLYLDQGWEVHGLMRRVSSSNTKNIDHIFNHKNFHLTYGDLADYGSIVNWVSKVQPDCFISAAAQSHVKISFDIPEYTFDVDATGVIRCLEAVRLYSPQTKFIQLSTSELFGGFNPPQNELTPMHPRSPYGAAKMAAYWATINYREAYNLFACNVIPFNYESPRRSLNFVTRKVTRTAARIYHNKETELVLGNLDAKRDWQHCKDVCNGIKLILESDKPDEYVLSSGEMHSVQELVELVFNKLNLNWKEYVRIDERYLRPTEVEQLCGDSSKIRKALGWKPEYTFDQLIDEMLENDLSEAKNE